MRQRFEIHYTPKHGSWLNMAECELSILSRQCLNRRIASAEILRAVIAAWTARRNQIAKTYQWRSTTANARIKLHRLYPSYHQ